MLAPADEISGEILIDYSKEWIASIYKSTGKEFGDTYGDHTGKLLFKTEDDFKNYRESSFNYKGWKLTLIKITDKITGEFKTKLKVKGNPSEIFYGKNYRNILRKDFVKILVDFANTFGLDIYEIKLTIPCEASVTIADPHDLVFNEDLIKGRLMCFQDEAFDIMRNKNGMFMGYEANNSHYSKKVYLPAIKFSEPLNYLRVEASYNRVQTFRKRTGIDTWGDLVSDKGMRECYRVVLDGWDNIIIYDPKLKRSKGYPDYLNEMIFRGRSVDYWLNEFPQTASDKTLKKRLEEYRLLSYQKGEGLHIRVRNWIQNEAEKFRNITSRLTCNNSELDSTVSIKDRYKKDDMRTVSSVQNKQLIKSKKQLAKEKREGREKQYQSFMYALSETVRKIEERKVA